MDNRQDLRQTLLLVDDEPTNLQLLRRTLGEQYRLLFAKNGQEALRLAGNETPDLILLDIMMPKMGGYQVCEALKADPVTRLIPVIFVTALSEAADEEHGFKLGAVDYITKPFNIAIVRARVATHLSLVEAQEVRETRLRIIECLGAAGEYRDTETGAHVIRMSHYSQRIAQAVGYSDRDADRLLHAAPMHDVGKIGIPDAVLLKPGKLDAEEWTVMRSHTVIGAKIIGNHASRLLQLAATLALRHHEKWDGSGYPDGLSGTDIPHEARIIAIADVFDALTSVRPYKKAWPVNDALALIRRERGQHFQPELVDAFFDCLSDILELRERWPDEAINEPQQC